MSTLRIHRLAGLFSGEGFLKKRGRHPDWNDIGFLRGPIDILVDEESGNILSLETSPTNPPAGALWDASGCLASAGWVDSHTHTLFMGHRAHEYFLRWKGASYQKISAEGGGIHTTQTEMLEASELDLFESTRSRLKQAFQSGITTLEVKSGYGKTFSQELRHLRTLKNLRELYAHSSEVPEIYATYLGLHALPKDVSENHYVQEMCAGVPQIAREKLAHFIDAFPEQGFFSLESARAFFEEGLKHGLKIKVHADEITPMGATEAFVPMGALSVDHLQHVSSQGIQKLREGSTVATLLPATSFYLGLPYAPARRLLQEGCAVALATDYNPGTAPEYRLAFTQLLAALHYKMSAPEIFCATTWNAAQALGLSDRGVVAPGFRADLLLWKAPLFSKTSEPNAYLEALVLHQLPLAQVFKAPSKKA